MSHSKIETYMHCDNLNWIIIQAAYYISRYISQHCYYKIDITAFYYINIMNIPIPYLLSLSSKIARKNNCYNFVFHWVFRKICYEKITKTCLKYVMKKLRKFFFVFSDIKKKLTIYTPFDEETRSFNIDLFPSYPLFQRRFVSFPVFFYYAKKGIRTCYVDRSGT